MDLVTRQKIEQDERVHLAPYALASVQSKGRKHPEKEHVFRTAFQRDRDRIIHSTAFRRLEYKTQVFVNSEGDHYRTRLTHSLETTQIARTIGRVLGLNEDLIEGIALAHDLGHGPFGHAGEWALHELMKKYGGFEHNEQCLRIVDYLEESYADFTGLNLTFEMREGLRKHAKNKFRFLEADIVDLSDEIAYNCHDLDDGFRAGLVDNKQAEEIELWRSVRRYIDQKAPKAPASIRTRMAVRLLINRLVSDLIEETSKRLKRYKIKTPYDLNRLDVEVVSFSKGVKSKMLELRKFLFAKLYHHYRVVRMTEKGQRFIKELFRVYVSRPAQLPQTVLDRSAKDGLERAVCDYIAGMTDRFALDEYNRLFSPYERV